MMKMTASNSRVNVLLLTFFVFMLVGSPAIPARAQVATPTEEPSSASSGVWHTTVGDQHVKLLRSRNDAVREAAMQNLIVLANLHPGAFDLTPTVSALLTIYEYDRNESHRIMAAVALRAVADKTGMEELHRLSSQEYRASRVYQVAQNAVNHYYTEQAMEREMERSAYYMAKGDVKRADQHALKAAMYRSKLG